MKISNINLDIKWISIDERLYDRLPDVYAKAEGLYHPSTTVYR